MKKNFMLIVLGMVTSKVKEYVGKIDFQKEVKEVIANGTQPSWTPKEQANARARLGLEKNWVLIGIISGDETDRGNIDTGLNVDLAGYTELYIIGQANATGSSPFSASFNNRGRTSLTSSLITSGTRYGFLHCINIGSNLEANGKYGATESVLTANCTAHFVPGSKIEDILAFSFFTPSSIKSCKYTIYAK